MVVMRDSRTAKGYLPNLLIVGAAKSGTTSLHRYLSLHPDIFMSKEKEIRFFDTREKCGRFNRGVDWYRTHFPIDKPIRGASSPQYALFPILPDVPRLIRETLGTPKIIYILRDPVERLLSDYVQTVDENYLRVSFEEFLNRDFEKREAYLYSRYHFQLSQYLKVFPRENICVILTERLATDPRATLRGIFDFLGVNPDFWTPDFDVRHNKQRATRLIAPWFDEFAPEFMKNALREPALRSRSWRLYRMLHCTARIGGVPVTKPPLTEKQEAFLQSKFAADVAALRTFLNDPLPEWRKYEITKPALEWMIENQADDGELRPLHKPPGFFDIPITDGLGGPIGQRPHGAGGILGGVLWEG